MTVIFNDPAVRAFIAHRSADIVWAGVCCMIDDQEGELPDDAAKEGELLSELRAIEADRRQVLGETKEALVDAKAETLFGAALKLNGIASYNVQEAKACISLIDDMLEMARADGHYIEDLPVPLYDLYDMLGVGRTANSERFVVCGLAGAA